MLNRDTLINAYKLMVKAKAMCELYETNKEVCKYAHSTSRGHEAIQIAMGLQLLPCDWVSPYYRDDSMLIAAGFTPYEMMLQLLAKKDDPFSGGRSYYCHPNNKDENRVGIIHQSGVAGMQAIPTTGLAQGLQYIEQNKLPYSIKGAQGENPIVVCSMGDGSVTEGEVSEAIQFAILKQLPVIYLIQDNQWCKSARADEYRTTDVFDYTKGFKGLKRLQCDGSDFVESYEIISLAMACARNERKPVLIHAKVPLLGHHSNEVRREFYRSREDLLQQGLSDPIPKLRLSLTGIGYGEPEIKEWEIAAQEEIKQAFKKAQAADDPDIQSIEDHIFEPTSVIEEKGQRVPKGSEKVHMVEATLHAISEIMEDHPEAVLYGQDVGSRLGGIFRETAELAEKFGDKRVFNTPIQEAYIVGSTVGMSALGLKPIVEIQFADNIYPAMNQLVTEIAKSCYLSNGKFPIQMVLRVPIGAYSGGGPYCSGSIESTLLTIKGIKVVYPSNAADMKGLMKAAFYDPNPVIMLEHKGLYWSKVPGSDDAQSIEPSRDYILPLGKGNILLTVDSSKLKKGETVSIITYGRGVYWAKNAALQFPGRVEIIDLRTLYPLDEKLIFESVNRHGKVIILSEEQQDNSFAEALSHRISNNCYHSLDAKVEVIGSLNLPAVPVNSALEAAMLPSVEKIKERIAKLLAY